MEEDQAQSEEKEAQPAASRGWGGWGMSMLSDLQKAATVAAEEISRNAVAVAKSAAKGVAEMQNIAVESESGEEEEEEEKDGGKVDRDGEVESDTEKLRRSALDKLENASENSFLGQGIKVIDSSVESLASGAWQALGSAWKGGSDLAHKIENSTANLADSIQQGSLPTKGGSLAPSLLETGKAFTAKGMQVLEYVGKETMDLLITEAGIDVDKNSQGADAQTDEQFEDVNFDRCFYIYGGPEHLEELEALSNHHSLLFGWKKSKLSSEQKSFYEGKLKQVQRLFTLSSEVDGSEVDSDKGKEIETAPDGKGDELAMLRNSSIKKAADMGSGFTAALVGQAANDIVQRTADRLEIIHSEGIHRLSELCCLAVSQLLILGKSVISNANESSTEDHKDDQHIEWPEDPVSKAKIVRAKTLSMTADVELVSNGFVTGIMDVTEAYIAAIKKASNDSHDSLPQGDAIQEKSDVISKQLRSSQTSALEKIQDGLHYLAAVVTSSALPSA